MILLRFGQNSDFSETKMSFPAIGKHLGISAQSVFGIIRRFKANGYRIVMGRAYNEGGKEKITYEIGSYLRS